MSNIYLLGMPGCGKSTLGKLLSDKLGLKHIDADLYLEEKYGENIPYIFENYGESEFRNRESICIEELSKLENVIISTGGGVVKRYINKACMNDSGIIVFIDTEPDTILSNSALGGRPLLKDKNNIYKLYKERIDLYRDFADIIVDNNSTTEACLAQILKSI